MALSTLRLAAVCMIGRVQQVSDSRREFCESQRELAILYAYFRRVPQDRAREPHCNSSERAAQRIESHPQCFSEQLDNEIPGFRRQLPEQC